MIFWEKEKYIIGAELQGVELFVIGALIILWIVIGITNLGKINTVAMAALFILTLILCKVIFTGSGVGTPSDDSMTFGAAVGNTLPDMVITIILCLIAGKLIPEKNQKK